MTRYEFARDLAVKMGLVPPGSSGKESAAALREAGITTQSEADFDGNAEVTRAEAATFFVRASGGTATSTESGLQQAVDEGWFKSIGDGSAGFESAWFNTPATAALAGDDPDPIGSPGVGDTIGDASVDLTNGEVGETPADDEDAWEWAASYLEQQFDLGGMSDWVVEMVQKYGNNLTMGVIEAEIYESGPFQERYGDVMDGRRDNGLNPMSPLEILDFETDAAATMRASGLPSGFYDDQSDFHDMMISNVSISELQSRIAIGFERVSMAPLEIRQAYADIYGPMGDEALASFLMDPDRSIPALERAVTIAEISGTGQQFGVSISQDRADELAGNGVDRNMAFTGFTRLSAMQELFEETVGETTDLTIESEGIDSQFLGQGAATRVLQRRGQGRAAAFSGGGGAATSTEGVFGAGTAN
jgi:hypothetical protein